MEKIYQTDDLKVGDVLTLIQSNGKKYEYQIEKIINKYNLDFLGNHKNIPLNREYKFYK